MLTTTTGVCFLLGMLVFAWSIHPYAVERLVPSSLPPTETGGLPVATPSKA